MNCSRAGGECLYIAALALRMHSYYRTVLELIALLLSNLFLDF